MGTFRLGCAVRPGQVPDPLPIHAAAPPFRDERLAEFRFKRQLQDLGYALVLLKLSDPNAAPEIQELRPKSDGGWRHGSASTGECTHPA